MELGEVLGNFKNTSFKDPKCKNLSSLLYRDQAAHFFKRLSTPGQTPIAPAKFYTRTVMSPRKIYMNLYLPRQLDFQRRQSLAAFLGGLGGVSRAAAADAAEAP